MLSCLRARDHCWRQSAIVVGDVDATNPCSYLNRLGHQVATSMQTVNRNHHHNHLTRSEGAEGLPFTTACVWCSGLAGIGLKSRTAFIRRPQHAALFPPAHWDDDLEFQLQTATPRQTTQRHPSPQSKASNCKLEYLRKDTPAETFDMCKGRGKNTSQLWRAGQIGVEMLPSRHKRHQAGGIQAATWQAPHCLHA